MLAGGGGWERAKLLVGPNDTGFSNVNPSFRDGSKPGNCEAPTYLKRAGVTWELSHPEGPPKDIGFQFGSRKFWDTLRQIKAPLKGLFPMFPGQTKSTASDLSISLGNIEDRLI